MKQLTADFNYLQKIVFSYLAIFHTHDVINLQSRRISKIKYDKEFQDITLGVAKLKPLKTTT
jgi:hypothetical protein